MNYTQKNNYTQLQLSTNNNFFMIPSFLDGFNNTHTTIETTYSQRELFCLHGTYTPNEYDSICPHCGKKMHINNKRDILLRHLCFGSNLTCVKFERVQYYCNDCHYTCMQPIPFKSTNHFITTELEKYTRDLLAFGIYTLKQVASITGLGKNTVKAIDKRRLQELYTIDGKQLIKPEKQARFLGIDEFKLHDGYKYATHIIDLETGHILWIQHGKKKQVVYDFIDHVGLDWMNNVEAVACDMNSDFQEAFEEKCEHITIVFDYFHIVKNFNDKVVTKVRIDEQKRLLDEGNKEAAASLKKTNYILKSKRETLQKKDKEAQEGKIIKKESSLFNIPEYKRKEGYEAKYDELIKENELLFKVDLMKNLLKLAYESKDENEMVDLIIQITELCEETNNKHFNWFKKLLLNHFEGIIAHATLGLSSGKIEGINNKIKTIRRMGYGYPDDEYFFLKLFDLSRTSYIRNQKSHKICD